MSSKNIFILAFLTSFLSQNCYLSYLKGFSCFCLLKNLEKYIVY